jgi:hypothetical protein
VTNTPIPFYKLGGEGIDGPKILGAIVALTGSEIYLCAKASTSQHTLRMEQGQLDVICVQMILVGLAL